MTRRWTASVPVITLSIVDPEVLCTPTIVQQIIEMPRPVWERTTPCSRCGAACPVDLIEDGRVCPRCFRTGLSTGSPVGA